MLSFILACWHGLSWMFYPHTGQVESRRVTALGASYPQQENMAIWWINIPASLPLTWDNSEDFSHSLADSQARLCSWVYYCSNWLGDTQLFLALPPTPLHFPVLFINFPWVVTQINLRNSHKTLCLSSALL